MAMVVKNNMSAVRTLATLNTNNTSLQDSLSKVASGLKINTAKDDASGYAISERMRVQIRSLDQANQNSQNASSLMKNAEGAVERTVEILRTLKQKAIDAASDTNTDDDRATIQKELDQLIDQIDDNALITFNGKYLLEGSRSQSGSAVSTHMTNGSLNTETNLNTRLIDLANRNGESIEINTTDKVTVSFIMGGKTYVSTLKSVKNGTRLGDIYSMLNTAVNGTSTAGTAFAEVTAATRTALGSATVTDSSTFYVGSTKVTDDGNGLSASTNTSGITFTANSSSKLINADTSQISFVYNSQTYTIDVFAGGDAKDTDAIKANAIINSYDGYSVNSSTYSSTSDHSLSINFKAYSYTSGTGNAASTIMTIDVYDNTYGGTASKVSEVSTDTSIGTMASGKALETADGKNAVTFKASSTGLDGQISGLSISISDSEGNVKKATNTALDNFKTTIYAANTTADGSVSFQIGASANQAVRVGLMDMRSEALGLKGKDGTTIKITTREAANAAVSAFDNALNKALDQQTTIGAISARLDYTASNLTTSSENVQAAESTIRDADMAKEMTNYTKNNVLLQAAQSMLAQANQNSSAVLSLLQ